MKITFEIDTQDPDQRQELIQLQAAGKMASSFGISNKDFGKR